MKACSGTSTNTEHNTKRCVCMCVCELHPHMAFQINILTSQWLYYIYEKAPLEIKCYNLMFISSSYNVPNSSYTWMKWFKWKRRKLNGRYWIANVPHHVIGTAHRSACCMYTSIVPWIDYMPAGEWRQCFRYRFKNLNQKPCTPMETTC